MTTFRWSLDEDVTQYCNAGVNAIGIWRPKFSELGEERGIELVKNSNLSVSSLSWIGGFTGSNGQSFADSLDDARAAIRVAGELNAKSVTVLSGARSGHTLNHARQLFVEALEELGDYALDHNVLLAVQPMHAMFAGDWTFLNSIDETLEILDRSNHPAMRMAFDVYHLWQEPNLLHRIREIVPLVSVVQLSDWNDTPRSRNDRSLPGDGLIPLDDITRAFVENGYDGHFEINVWSEQLWRADVDYDALVADCVSRYRQLCRPSVIATAD